MNSIDRHFDLGELFKVETYGGSYIAKCVSTKDPKDNEVILRILNCDDPDSFECLSDFLNNLYGQDTDRHYANFIEDFTDYSNYSFVWSCDVDMIKPLSKDIVDTKLARKMYKNIIELDNNLIRVWND